MDKIEEVLTRGVEKIYPNKKALEKILRSGKKIRLYQGFDPSMPNLHLGHMAGILKLKQFQDLGHEVIFLVGDFTGMIGDPTDKEAVRKKLSREQVKKNCRSWQEQAGRLLNFSGKNPVKWLFNSQWLDKVTFKELIEITSHFTVQQMIERDFFRRRLKKNRPIYLHEFLYPVAQAIDCVEMDVQLEVGGNDQTFNMLSGRTLMKALKGKEKFVLTTKLLVDNKGKKVGKTAGNALFLNTSSGDLYGGVMAFPDEVIPLAFELLTLVPLESVKTQAKPMEEKKRLAFEVVKLYHGEKAAKEAKEEFERVFQKRGQPQQVPVYQVARKKDNLINLLKETGLVESASEAKRLIRQGGVEVDGKVISEPQEINLKDEMIIQVGKKRFIKIKTK